jgi:DNA polymerase-4
VEKVADKVWRYCEKHSIRGRTVTLKVKYADFQQITRSRTQQMPLASAADLLGIAFELLAGVFPTPKGIRLLGVTLSSLEEPAREDSSDEGGAQLKLTL